MSKVNKVPVIEHFDESRMATFRYRAIGYTVIDVIAESPVSNEIFTEFVDADYLSYELNSKVAGRYNVVTLWIQEPLTLGDEE